MFYQFIKVRSQSLAGDVYCSDPRMIGGGRCGWILQNPNKTRNIRLAILFAKSLHHFKRSSYAAHEAKYPKWACSFTNHPRWWESLSVSDHHFCRSGYGAMPKPHRSGNINQHPRARSHHRRDSARLQLKVKSFPDYVEIIARTNSPLWENTAAPETSYSKLWTFAADLTWLEDVKCEVCRARPWPGTCCDILWCQYVRSLLVNGGEVKGPEMI